MMIIIVVMILRFGVYGGLVVQYGQIPARVLE